MKVERKSILDMMRENLKRKFEFLWEVQKCKFKFKNGITKQKIEIWSGL